MNNKDYNYIKKHATDYLCRTDIYGKLWCSFFCGDVNFNTVAVTEHGQKQINELMNSIDKRKKSNGKQKDTPSN